MVEKKKNLTQRTYLNTVTNLVAYGATVVSAFIVSPLLVSYLGSGLFGVWKICQRLLTYAEVADGRATQALKWTIANKQETADAEAKRRDVGCAIIVWIRFLPFLLLVGALLSWFAPFLIRDLERGYFTLVRLVCAILVFNTILLPLQNIPESVMIGMNMSYRCVWVRIFVVALTAVLMIIAAYVGWGVTGVALALVTATIVRGGVILYLAKRHVDWFGIAKPSKEEFGRFFGFSIWIFAWTFVTRLMLSGDVVILGYAASAEQVTSFVLTQYVMQMSIGVVGYVVSAATPGLGGIFGQNKLAKAGKVRDELMTAAWFITTVIGSMILLWNRSFVNVWVGSEQYAGTIENLLMVILTMQLIFIRNDAYIIDITLNIKQKVLLGAFANVFAVILGFFFANYWESSVAGLVTGLVIGRSILSISYPLLVNRAFEQDCKRQFKPVLRCVFISGMLFWVATSVGSRIEMSHWYQLILSASLSFVVIVSGLFYFGLTVQQRSRSIARLRSISVFNR